MSKALILQVYDPLSSYFLREHFHAVYKGDVCSITWSTLRMLPTTWWQLGGKQEGVLPCSRALQQDTRSLWSSAFTWVLTTAFSATTPPRREASKHGGGMMRGNWKIRSKSAGRGEALHPPPPQTLAPSTKHVNIAAGHLTPFPRDALVYTGGTPSWRFICATFPAPSIPPLHHHYLSHLFSVHSSSGGNIKMRCVHSESAVTISSPPSLPLPLCRLLSPYMAEPHKASERSRENTARRKLKYDTMILSRLRVSLQQCDISIWSRRRTRRKEGEKEREVVVRGANEKINTQAAFQYLVKQPDIACCSVIGGAQEYNGNHSSPLWRKGCLAAVCHVKSVSPNSCMLPVHHLSSVQGSAQRDFITKPLWQQLSYWQTQTSTEFPGYPHSRLLCASCAPVRLQSALYGLFISRDGRIHAQINRLGVKMTHILWFLSGISRAAWMCVDFGDVTWLWGIIVGNFWKPEQTK